MPQFVYLKDIIQIKQKESYQSMESSLEPNIKEKVMSGSHVLGQVH
jgi:hypothetical protein